MKKTKNDNLNENTKETSKDVIDETCRESIAMDEKEKLNEEKQEKTEVIVNELHNLVYVFYKLSKAFFCSSLTIWV